MTRDEVETKRLEWLAARAKTAFELNTKYELSDNELERARHEAKTGAYAGPLMLENGKFLPEHLTMPGMPKASKRERSHE